MTSLGSSNSTSSNSSAASLANSIAAQASGQPGSVFPRLKVEDALTYLDQVKLQFERQPEVYNQFLDIMKEFKSQAIDTPGVISRVSTLFKGHNDLIEGFNTFLPPGYKIEIQANDLVHYTAPNSSMSTLVNQNVVVKPKNVQQTMSASAIVPATLVTNNGTQLPLNLAGANLVKSETPKLEPIVLATIPNNSNFKNLAQPLKLAPVTSTPSLVPLQNQPAQISVSTNQASTINAANAIVQQIANPQSSQSQAPSSQVEFGHAINYVNKIKARFSNQPEVYKSFLEILHTYQKQQKNMKDGIIPTNFLSESEVYAKVASLFKNQEDLLVEFSQFLPDANANQNNQTNSLATSDLSQLSAAPSQPANPPVSPKVKSEQNQTSTEPHRPLTPGDNASVSSISSNSSQKPIKRPTTSIPICSKKPKLNATQTQKPSPQSTPKPAQPSNLTNKSLTLTKHQPQAGPDSLRFGPINEITFFEKLKKALRTPQVYENFLKCLALFNQNIITTSELIKLVEPFLSKFSNLYRWFKDYVENIPFNGALNADCYSTDSAKEKISLPANNIHLEIDYLACKQYGASYRDISSYPQPISSGQTELCKLVLNSSYVSFPSWSEDSTFVTSRKNQYEDQMFRIEDERFELDVVLETNLCTIKVLENLMSKMGRMKSDELAKFKLDDSLGGDSQIVHMKAVQRIYADKSKDFIEGLKQNPQVAVPLVLKRLKAKDEEWREAKKNLEKTWREQVEKNYLKSLDYLATPFKQNDQKFLKTKSMINEIESIYNERNEAREESLAASGAHQSVVAGEAIKNCVLNHSDPHLVFRYEDKSVLEDAAALIIHHVKRQTTIQKEDKHKIKQIVYLFLPDLFFVSRGTLSDDESSDKLESDDNSGKKLRSNNGNGTPAARHTDTNKRRLTDVDVERNRNLPNEYKSPKAINDDNSLDDAESIDKHQEQDVTNAKNS
ncbi:Paired amphipathic helix Sin3a [Brachionus plicatilis]|uniref:Paired amphipathic helix protein Sin3b n=1 Tax=Brachionus plicatilis TaxID=10195 RepID=A0A3M7SDF5_BRAPC|nr:Paired amphipathic helix Sin3a [Brachionus plicatilis]